MQSIITIPARFREKLSEEQQLSGAIDTILERFGPWIKGSGMPFFPYYTDHGQNHLSRILAICDWLMTDQAWRVLTANDVACVILAVLLHDSAMHLTPDSFRALINVNNTKVIFPSFDEYTWPQLWMNFQAETKHWDVNKWAAIVGVDFKERLELTVGEMYEVNLGNLSEAEFPIIGEFIRRYHGRLGHEFAFNGIPNESRQEKLQLELPEGYFQLGNVAGLVARSHTVGIRDTYNYLDEHYFGKLEVYRTHPVFLMAVLRLADYLDLYSERAPKNLLRVKEIRSQFSSREWEAHQAIKEIRYDASNDPERIEVIAFPNTAAAFQKILSWVNGIQSELDHSWAVLGEVYGRHKRLRNLTLRLRRIFTPLTDEDFAIKHNLGFDPNLCQITVDAGRLVQLLIRPLYGSRPEIAAREMVQNAVDAVREYDVYKTKVPISRQIYPILTEMDADIFLCLCMKPEYSSLYDTTVPSDWHYWLEIVDGGIGMTEEIIRNYFLKAGASLRNSIYYSKQFTKEDRARTFRSGSFGIGVLAYFLAGQRLQVTSRHVNKSYGISFECAPDSEDIELRHVDVPTGTLIRLKLTEESYQKLSIPITNLMDNRGLGKMQSYLDWYVLGYPKVVVAHRIGREISLVSPGIIIPDPKPISEWFCFSVENSTYVQWSFNAGINHTLLYLNGIYVGEQDKMGKIYAEEPLKTIAINVMDSANRFPISIIRNTYNGEFPFQSELIKDVLTSYIAWLFIEAGTLPDERSLTDRASLRLMPQMVPGGGILTTTYAFNSAGILPLTSWHIHNAKMSRVYGLITDFWDERHQPSATTNRIFQIPSSSPLFIQNVVLSPYEDYSIDKVISHYLYPIKASYIPTQKLSLIPWLKNFTLVTYESRGLIPPNTFEKVHMSEENGLIYTSVGMSPHETVDIKSLMLSPYIRDNQSLWSMPRREAEGIVGIYCTSQIPNIFDPICESILADLWNEFQLPAFIPVDIGERQLLLQRSSPKLRDYVERQEFIQKMQSG